MKKTKTLAALVAALAFLAGCGPSLSAGTVVAKEFRPGWTQMVQSCIPQSNGSPPICTMTPIIHPDCFMIVISDGEARNNFCLKPEIYDIIEVGDYFSKES